MKHLYAVILASFIFLSLHAQNTVGLLSYDPMTSYDGYNLFYAHNQPNVYLINNCGQIVHTWSDSAQYRPGNTAYLLDNGDLVKTKRHFDNSGNRIQAGGGGDMIEVRDWDNNLKWSFSLNDSLRRVHHDIAVTNEGTILMIVWELKTLEESLAAGRDTSRLSDGELWPDYILEMDPETDQVVWEWHAWDHLIQDFDSTKANYGVVGDHPELIDVNYTVTRQQADWMHCNSLDYNPFLDMIMISVPGLDEVWIVDHTTTTQEAASHSGGLGQVGGDLLYRWGNPATYQAGDTSDQQLFFQHDAQWVDDYLPFSHPDFGKVAVFNNRAGVDFSTANIFAPVFVDYGHMFQMDNGRWLPEEFDETYTHPIPTMMYSTGLSSIQPLPNGNTLICVGRFGYSFELTPDNDIVWEYKTPLQSGNPVAQGTNLTINSNPTFRMKRIPVDNPVFDGRDLSSQGYLELNPNLNFCDSLTSTMGPVTDYHLNVYPNPATDELTIEWHGPELVEISVYNALGQPITSYQTYGGRIYVNTSDWVPGFHFIMINGEATKVVLIQ